MTVIIKQENGFALFTRDSWKSHLHMVKMQFMQEVSLDEAEELISDYENSFQVSAVTPDQVLSFKNQFGVLVNETRKLESSFGQINHF